MLDDEFRRLVWLGLVHRLTCLWYNTIEVFPLYVHLPTLAPNEIASSLSFLRKQAKQRLLCSLSALPFMLTNYVLA
jgi:uncharacterized protein (DUF983 family)